MTWGELRARLVSKAEARCGGGYCRCKAFPFFYSIIILAPGSRDGDKRVVAAGYKRREVMETRLVRSRVWMVMMLWWWWW
jgi:hypothetical protein